MRSNLFKRTITGAVFVAVLVFCIWYSKYTFIALFSLITVAGLAEFYRITDKTNAQSQHLWGVVAGTAAMVITTLALLNMIDPEYIFLLLALLPLTVIFELYRKKYNPFGGIALTILGICYIALPFALLGGIGSVNAPDYDSTLVLTFFALVWISDTGAYVVGKSFGRTKLFARISPGKTWEGSFGAILLTVAAAAAFSKFLQILPLFHMIVVALIIVICGTLGDLAESMLKRSTGIKDSGSILPGHGGILDRFDAVLLAAPVVYLYLKLVVR